LKVGRRRQAETRRKKIALEKHRVGPREKWEGPSVAARGGVFFSEAGDDYVVSCGGKESLGEQTGTTSRADIRKRKAKLIP